MKKVYSWFLIPVLAFIFWGAGLSGITLGQQTTGAKIEELRNRLNSLEADMQKMQSGVNEFSKALVASIDQRMQAAKSKAVILNPLSRKVSKIETNIGNFLLAVSRMDKIDNGYRVYLQIGNPNAATYGDVKFRVYWGKSLTSDDNYDKWRQSLKGAEFAYTGNLEAGVWTDIAVDLKPADFDQTQYIECDMDVNTVKLQKARILETDNTLK